MSFQLKLERRHRLSTPSSKQLNSLWLHMLQGSRVLLQQMRNIQGRLSPSIGAFLCRNIIPQHRRDGITLPLTEMASLTQRLWRMQKEV